MSRQEFPRAIRIEAFTRCKGFCEGCGTYLHPHGFHYDHILPCGLGGKATLDNCQVLCWPCHMQKTCGEERKSMAKADRVGKKWRGEKKLRGRPIPGSKASGWRKRMNGTVERRHD